MMNACITSKNTEEKQLTLDPSYNHDLDNNDNFSPDGKWLVYDTRTDSGGIAESGKIERINIETGEIKVVYELKNNAIWGPGVGAVSYSPTANKVVFIHGLMGNTQKNPYQQWRRTGAIVDVANPNVPIWMDARDVTPLFTAGALRGGTHRHEWSGNGQWIGYTYNDQILKELEDATGKKHNLRTIGVSKNIKSVTVDNTEDNISGAWYSVLVVRVVAEPKPGSDEISMAASDSWVGLNGYTKTDGSQQIARAFLGATKAKNGKTVQEVFVVDIPDDITIPGEFGPLEGTATEFPMPPKGTVQRRLTFTAETENPGCSGIVRSSPDGKNLAYLAQDKNGISQIYLISPNGGAPTQLTESTTDIKGGLRWNPNGLSISYVHDGSILLCKIGSEPFENRVQILTKPAIPAPSNLVWSPNGKVLAFNKLVTPANDGVESQQIFVVEVE